MIDSVLIGDRFLDALERVLIYLFNLFCTVIFFNSLNNFIDIDLVILFYSGIKK